MYRIRRRYRRIPVRRRIGYRPRVRFNKNSYLFSLGRKVKAIEKSQELKYQTYQIIVPTTNSQYMGTCISGIAEGIGITQRIGKRITIKSVEIYASATEAGAITDSASVNCFVVCFRRPHGSELETSNTWNGLCHVYSDHYGDTVHMHEKTHFWVMARKHGFLVGSSPREKMKFHYFKKFKKGLEVGYEDGTANATKIEKNALYFICASTDVTNAPWSGNCKITYIDS